jgi:transposase
MRTRLRLSRAARRRLQRLDRKTRDADLRIRCRVILKVDQGLSARAAAREVGCVPSTAARIVARFLLEDEASLYDRRAENGERKVDEDARQGLREILWSNPATFGYQRTTWSLELLARVAAERLALQISVGHLWKVLRQLKVRWGCAWPIVACPWPAGRRRRRLRELRRLQGNAGDREVVLFEDEVDIHLNPRIGRDWMLPGQQKLVLTPGKNQKAFIAGAYDPRTGRIVCVDGDRKAVWLFLNLLRALLNVYRAARRIHLILDNYAIHKSQVVTAFLRTIGQKIELHFLPPYCPEENRIERLWKDVHDSVTRNHRCRDLQELLDRVCTYLASRLHVHWGVRHYLGQA